jgi:hypothetical protein
MSDDGAPIKASYIEPAFPTNTGYEGLTLLQYYAAHAPITIQDAADLLSYDDAKDKGKLFKALADLRLSYARAMVEAG